MQKKGVQETNAGRKKGKRVGKRIGCILLILSLLVLFAGCSANEGQAETAGQTQQQVSEADPVTEL